MTSDKKNWSFISGVSAESRERASSEFVDAQLVLSAPRKMMAALKDIMAQETPVDDKLAQLLEMVARELRTDVCSCFIRRAGDLLELYDFIGLPEETSVKIRVGQGLVGDVAAHAAPILEPDITSHSQYRPRPELGNGDFKAFCGVPVLRNGQVRGVLVIQNRLPRQYNEEVADILQTVAMVVAELIVAGGLVTRQEINSASAAGGKPTQVEAVSLGRGLAIGTAVLYEPGIEMRDIVADDTKKQKMRLREALSSMHTAIDKILDRNKALSGTESQDILEAYQMFAKDRGWLAKIENAIGKGLSAEAAVQRVQNETRARMMKMSDAYIRERLQDLEGLSNRLLNHLVRRDEKEKENLPESIILVARSLGPAALLDYDHSRLKAVVLEKGSHSNHVAIVARSLGIPVVGQCRDISGIINNGDQMIVDGDQGSVYINPSSYVVEMYTRSIEARQQRANLYLRRAHQPSVTKDGKKISVMLNAGLVQEVSAIQSVGAEGVGLFRTELAFMGWKKFPLIVTQAELYGKILDESAGKPVIFRTLDIGGDKPLPYFTPPFDEENPALGWRAIRIGMDRPAVLRAQFRAFLLGAGGRPLKIMLPFVTEVAEFDRAQVLLEMEKKRARNKGIEVSEDIELGLMLEVPALLWQLDTLLDVVDFISVGTNDLMQYLYAADRGNHTIRSRYDVLSPAMLSVLKTIADKCSATETPVGVCGEMAGYPLEAMVLIALGFDTLSVPLQSVEAVKTMIPTLDTTRLQPYLERLMLSREHSLRELLLSFARDHNVNILQAM